VNTTADNTGVPALLAERLDPGQKDGRILELGALARAAGYRVVDTVTQRRRAHPGFQLGRGKVTELAELARQSGAQMVLFQNTLSASQVFHIEKDVGVGVGDRGDVILEIFARRARTPEARLQVELAHAMHELPRARAKVSHRVGAEQPGFMGLGRFGYDVYERHLRHRIAELRRELAVIGARDTQRRGRRRMQGFDLVTLAGYTNAGKSSLLNALTTASADVDDDVFTTLSPTTRAADIGGRRVLLTDTVGFIRDLPPFLLRAFRTTLAEVQQADLVVVVVDAGEPPEAVSQKLSASLDTLRNIGLHAPLVCAMNKADLLPKERRAPYRDVALAEAGDAFKAVVFTSATERDGLDDLLSAVEESLPPWKKGDVALPTDEPGQLLAWLHREGRVTGVNDGVAAWEAPPASWGRLAKLRLDRGEGKTANQAGLRTSPGPP